MTAPPIPADFTTMTSEEALHERLARIEHEVREGKRAEQSIGRRFAFFAFLALVIALANLIVVAAKLDGKRIVTVKETAAAPARAVVAAAPAPARDVAVSLAEYSIKPSSSVGKAGRISFDVRNAGTMPHEFVVLRTSKPAGDLFKGNRADETGNVGETGDLAPGASKTIRLNLKPGRYALICNLPGHYMAGQHADFTVR